MNILQLISQVKFYPNSSISATLTSTPSSSCYSCNASPPSFLTTVTSTTNLETFPTFDQDSESKILTSRTLLSQNSTTSTLSFPNASDSSSFSRQCTCDIVLRPAQTLEFTEDVAVQEVTAILVPYVTILSNGQKIASTSTFIRLENSTANATSSAHGIPLTTSDVTWETLGTTLFVSHLQKNSIIFP